MTRLKFDNISSFGTTNPITLLTTTTTTVGFLSAPNFPTIAATETGGVWTNYAAVIVQPDTANEEIIWVIAYTSGATTATVLRAQEGTSGVAVTGAEWAHAPTVQDFQTVPPQPGYTSPYPAPVPFINALDFGADPTFTNDSTSALNAAILEAASYTEGGVATGIELRIPAGVYAVDASLGGGTAGLAGFPVIKGAGKYATRLQATTAFGGALLAMKCACAIEDLAVLASDLAGAGLTCVTPAPLDTASGSGGAVTMSTSSNVVTFNYSGANPPTVGDWFTVSLAGPVDGNNNTNIGGYAQSVSHSGAAYTVHLYTAASGGSPVNASIAVPLAGPTYATARWATPNPISEFAVRRCWIDNIKNGNTTVGAVTAWDQLQGTPSQIGDVYYEDILVTNYQNTVMESLAVTSVANVWAKNCHLDMTNAAAGVRVLNFTGHQQAIMDGVFIGLGPNSTYDLFVLDDSETAGQTTMTNCKVSDPYGVGGISILQNQLIRAANCSFGANGAKPVQLNVVNNAQDASFVNCSFPGGIQVLHTGVGNLKFTACEIGQETVSSSPASVYFPSGGGGLGPITCVDTDFTPGSGNDIFRAATGQASPIYITGGSTNGSGIINNGTLTGKIIGLAGYNAPIGSPPGFFDVLDYGATGTGTTDDTAAIQAAALAADAAGGGIVWLPEGIYDTTASLLQYSYVTYKGAGIDATIIRANVSFTYAIQAKGTPGAQVVESGIQDLTIDTQNVADSDALLIQYVSFLRVDRVKMANCAYKCVDFGSLGRSNDGSPDGVLNGTITVTSASLNFTSADVGQPIYGAGIPAGTTISTRVSATTIHLSQAATASASGVLLAIGYTATENDHIFFTDCEFVDQNQVHPGNQEAITIGDVTTMRFTRCTWNTVYCAALAYQLANDISFDDCTVNGNTFYGFNLAVSCNDITFRNTKVFGTGSSGNFGLFTGSVSDNGLFASTTVNRVKTVACRFSGGYGGMLLAAVNDFVDIGSTLDTNYTSGVVLETSGGGALAQNVRFIGTEFRNNNQSTISSNINAGVQFNTPGAQDFKAIGCVFTDDQVTPTQLYPISFQGTGTAGTSIFTDVTVHDCTLTPYGGGLSIGYVSAASLGARGKISSSPPYNPQAPTTPTPSSGTALALASGLTTVPYDVQVMLTTVAGTLTSSVAVNGGTVTQPPAVAGVYSYSVPAGSTLTPTFTGTAPSCVVFPE